MIRYLDRSYTVGSDKPKTKNSFRDNIERAIVALESSNPISTREIGSVRARIAVLQEMLDSPWEQAAELGVGGLGLKLRTARVAAGLTQEQAASRAGISLASYRNCERAYRTTSEVILTKVARVPELGFPLSTGGGHEKPPSWWVDPRFEPLQMLQDLQHTLNGSGGRVEQSLLYLDHQSAADFLALSGASQYASRFRDLMPLEETVAAIRRQTGDNSIDVIGLGSGDGRQEVGITQLLSDSFEQPDLKLVLLDVSQPLLNAAYRYAADIFEKKRGVAVFALQGNFHHLPSFTQLHYRPDYSRRRKVITMLGKTISNLDDEIQFFRYNLSPFAPGDVVVLDFHEAAQVPWAINDPVVQRPVPAAHQAFLGGPVWRYCRDVISVSFKYELGPNHVVPGSYAVEANATVETKSGLKRFTMFKFKRYDPKLLAAALKEVGWALAGSFSYGTKVDERAQIMVLRKHK